MGEMQSLTDNNIDSFIENPKPKIVVLWADYVATSLQLRDTVQDMEDSMPDIEFWSANAGYNEDFISRFSLTYVPSVIAFKGSELVGARMGRPLSRDIKTFISEIF